MSESALTIELLRRAKAGDGECLDRLLELYRPRLLERIRMMMGPAARNAAESIDFLQEVMVDIVAKLDGFEVRDAQSFLRWGVRIARNRIVDAVRRQHEQAVASFSAELRGLMASGASPSQEAAQRSEAEHLIELLERLPEHYRQVLELRHFEGRGFRAIGMQMGRSENAVQLLHAQALTALGQLAAKSGG
jgi:RNA polymerase sigma-70 factor (ECF subfamily)